MPLLGSYGVSGFRSSIPDPLQVGQVMETLSFPEPEQETQDMWPVPPHGPRHCSPSIPLPVPLQRGQVNFPELLQFRQPISLVIVLVPEQFGHVIAIPYLLHVAQLLLYSMLCLIQIFPDDRRILCDSIKYPRKISFLS